MVSFIIAGCGSGSGSGGGGGSGGDDAQLLLLHVIRELSLNSARCCASEQAALLEVVPADRSCLAGAFYPQQAPTYRVPLVAIPCSPPPSSSPPPPTTSATTPEKFRNSSNRHFVAAMSTHHPSWVPSRGAPPPKTLRGGAAAAAAAGGAICTPLSRNRVCSSAVLTSPSPDTDDRGKRTELISDEQLIHLKSYRYQSVDKSWISNNILRHYVRRGLPSVRGRN